MAYNYNANQQLIQNAVPQQQNYNFQAQQQNVQPLFPQPQGNVYNINSTLEVANVPTGAGISVALCLNEGLMYIKSMQNGNPLFWAYKIEPYNNIPKENSNQVNEEISNLTSSQLEEFNNRFVKIESQINELQKNIKPNGGEFPL